MIKASSDLEVDPGYISEPESIEFPTEGGLTAYMNYYPPKNKDFDFPPGELPALLVKIHGGPTSSASTVLNLGYQFWTSRGGPPILYIMLLGCCSAACSDCDGVHMMLVAFGTDVLTSWKYLAGSQDPTLHKTALHHRFTLGRELEACCR